MNPTQTLALTDGGSPYGGTFTVNHLAGQVTLSAPPSGTLGTAALYYLSLNAAAEVREFSINLSRDELDSTVFNLNDKTYITGLSGATGTISGLELTSALFLTGAQARSIETIFDTEPLFVLDIYLDRDTRRGFRAFVKIPALDLSGARDGLVESSFNWVMSEVSANQSVTGKASYAFFTHQT